MFGEEFERAAGAAKAKIEFLKGNPTGFFISSMLSGFFVGLGMMFIFTIGGLLAGLPYVRVVMGASFGISLSLVVMAGSELFTGNNFVMSAGMLGGTTKAGPTFRLWGVCFVGNWLGGVLLALAFVGSGLADGPTGTAIAASAAAKMSLPIAQLVLRGILCNTLVCLAVWSTFRCKTESARLIMFFWCLFAFITTGYEHSVANMSLLTVALLGPAQAAISWGGYFYNLFWVSLGNMAGGFLCVALPYALVSRKRQ